MLLIGDEAHMRKQGAEICFSQGKGVVIGTGVTGFQWNLHLIPDSDIILHGVDISFILILLVSVEMETMSLDVLSFVWLCRYA